MRITVKYLQEQLENERINSNRYYKLWQEAKLKIEEEDRVVELIEYNRKDLNELEIGRLMEIIRVLAKDPRLEMIANERTYASKY